MYSFLQLLDPGGVQWLTLVECLTWYQEGPSWSLTRGTVFKMKDCWVDVKNQIKQTKLCSRGARLKPHQRHCVVFGSILSKITILIFSLVSRGSTSKMSQHSWNIVNWDIKHFKQLLDPGRNYKLAWTIKTPPKIGIRRHFQILPYLKK